MTKNKPPRWLKKYTRLEFLESTLNEQQMHLSKPQRWCDKNDRELLTIYSDASSMHEIRAACFTSAADRYHFWAIFGEYEKGVCLWFDRDQLLNDVGADRTLVAEQVHYLTPIELSRTKFDRLPFAKRKQYADEQELRVIRNYPSMGPGKDGFHFSASSLRRVYLNPWLTGKDFRNTKTGVLTMLKGRYEHVRVLQNRTLRQRAWICAARAVSKASQ